MPDIGGSPGVLTIKRWFKAVGDSLAKGELLANVEGAEGLIELQAAEPGVLAVIHALAGVSVAPGTPIAEFQDASSVKMETKQGKPVMSSKSTGQVTPILMPQAGNSMEEGTIVK